MNLLSAHCAVKIVFKHDLVAFIHQHIFLCTYIKIWMQYFWVESSPCNRFVETIIFKGLHFMHTFPNTLSQTSAEVFEELQSSHQKYVKLGFCNHATVTQAGVSKSCP